MAHSHHMHREQQVAHRRVAKILSGEPSGSMQHNDSKAFSKVTSKSAAERHDDTVSGDSSPKRYARGGKVKGKHGHQTNIAIVVPGAKGAAGGPPPGGPPPDAMGPPPGAGGPPGGPPMPPPGAGGPPGMPPGMPMHASGGRIKKAGGGPTPYRPGVPPSARESGDAARQTREILEQRGIVTPSKKRGGGIDGESTAGDIKQWSGRAKDNSYARGGMTAGAESGVGRLQKARRK